MTSSAYAAGPVGYLAGLLVERFGVRPAFLAMAGGLLVVALVPLLLFRGVRLAPRPIACRCLQRPVRGYFPL